MKKSSLLIIVLFIVSGCANTDNRIINVSAKKLNASPQEIKLISVERDLLDVNWTVDLNGKTFNCWASDMLENPECKEQK